MFLPYDSKCTVYKVLCNWLSKARLRCVVNNVLHWGTFHMFCVYVFLNAVVGDARVVIGCVNRVEC